MPILDEIFGAIIAALLVMLAVLLIANANLRADVATLHANAATLGSANAQLKDEADRQNRAIIAFKSGEETRALAAAQAVAAADVKAAKYLNQAAFLQKEKLNGDDCAGAKQILQDYLKSK